MTLNIDLDIAFLKISFSVQSSLVGKDVGYILHHITFFLMMVSIDNSNQPADIHNTYVYIIIGTNIFCYVLESAPNLQSPITCIFLIMYDPI